MMTANHRKRFPSVISCATNLIIFCDKITGCKDKGKAIVILCLKSSKLSDVVSVSILKVKLVI